MSLTTASSMAINDADQALAPQQKTESEKTQ
jgi:hypothetical protein